MFEVKRAGPVLVDVFLASARISGLTRLIEERRRLVDVLNGPEVAFELSDAAISGSEGRLALVQIQKAAILAAIPHETEEHLRVRAVLNTGIQTQLRRPVKVLLVVPPLRLEGTAFLPFAAGKARLELGLMSRFFPVTDVTLTLAEGEGLAAKVAVVNRDAVAVIAEAM